MSDFSLTPTSANGIKSDFKFVPLGQNQGGGNELMFPDKTPENGIGDFSPEDIGFILGQLAGEDGVPEIGNDINKTENSSTDKPEEPVKMPKEGDNWRFNSEYGGKAENLAEPWKSELKYYDNYLKTEILLSNPISYRYILDDELVDVKFNYPEHGIKQKSYGPFVETEVTTYNGKKFSELDEETQNKVIDYEMKMESAKREFEAPRDSSKQNDFPETFEEYIQQLGISAPCDIITSKHIKVKKDAQVEEHKQEMPQDFKGDSPYPDIYYENGSFNAIPNDWDKYFE